jgi:archaellum biogenesis ATPase FlaH
LGIGNAPGYGDGEKTESIFAKLVKVWERDEPEARTFALEGFIPDGSVTALFGDGGFGKSLLAHALCIHICVGRPFLGKSVEKRAALYLDAELEIDEFTRRSYRIARGLGLHRPPEGLHYHQLTGPLSDPNIQAQVRLYAASTGAGFIVLDSLTMATYESDPVDPRPMISTIKFLETLGTVLVIDHIAKPAPGANLSHSTQFGSAFKRNAVRSQIQVIQADGGGLTLLHKKANFSTRAKPLHLTIEFVSTIPGVDEVHVTAINADDDRLAGQENNLPVMEQVYQEVASHDETGATAEAVANALNKNTKSVQNYLSQLHKQNRVERAGNSVWRAVKTNSHSQAL